MFVVKSGVNSGIFVVFFVIEHFLAINLSTKEVLLYEINIWTNKAVHTHCKAIIACLILFYPPKMNTLSAYGDSADFDT